MTDQELTQKAIALCKLNGWALTVETVQKAAMLIKLQCKI
jgi:hypothetical protein